MPPSGPLGFKQTDAVTAKVEAAAIKYPFAEDVFNSAIWRLVRDPNCGEILPGYDPVRRLLVLMPNRFAGSPGLLLRYIIGADGEGHPRIEAEWVDFLDYDGTTGGNVPKAFGLDR